MKTFYPTYAEQRFFRLLIEKPSNGQTVLVPSNIASDEHYYPDGEIRPLRPIKYDLASPIDWGKAYEMLPTAIFNRIFRPVIVGEERAEKELIKAGIEPTELRVKGIAGLLMAKGQLEENFRIEVVPRPFKKNRFAESKCRAGRCAFLVAIDTNSSKPRQIWATWNSRQA